LRNALAKDPTLARRMAEDLGSRVGPKRAPAERRLRASLLRLYSGDDGRYLDYYGPPRTVKTLPYYQALRSPQPVDLSVRGKAVFVGFSAALPSEQDPIRDDYRTVFSRPDGLDLSGVEIAATAFANLVEDREVRPIEFPWNLFLFLSWGFVLGVVCRSVRTAAAVACVVLAGVIYALTARHQFAAAGLWLPLVVPLCLQPAAAMFGGLWLRYREAGGERELIKRIFGYYLPEHVVDRLARSVGPMTSDNQVVFGVCLATDAERYTTLSETMEPNQIAALMNDYYAALFEPVERHGGIVSDVVGDAMLAIWAGSSAERSLRNRACHAALDIAEAVRKFGAGGERSMIPTRIGLHSGRMLLGNIGASRHFEYRAVGDIVNTATRIEGLGKYVGSRLLVSEDVLDGLDEFLARPLGSFLLAGKTQPVRVSELLVRRVDAGDPHEWLCRRFALALDAYREQRWIEAGEILAEILAAFPEDGPAWFFLRRCEHLAAHPPQGPWDPTIRFEAK
ncbi:MAG: adenylate/guanylate cyclase domain-containing protein, partial [Rudaea sp.]